jgi:hypothetical protein
MVHLVMSNGVSVPAGVAIAFYAAATGCVVGAGLGLAGDIVWNVLKKESE